MVSEQIQQLAVDLVATCSKFLCDDCGRAEAGGVADPWLETEESYKRAHSYAVRYATSWKDAETYAEGPSLLELEGQYQRTRVLKVLASDGFDTLQLAKRCATLEWEGYFASLMEDAGTMTPSLLNDALSAGNDVLNRARLRIDEGTAPAARLRQMLDRHQVAGIKPLYNSVLKDTNLVVWSHWPSFSERLARELVSFIESNTAELNASSFRRFSQFLARLPSPERSKGTTLKPASVRTVATFWLYLMNPRRHLFLRKNSFGRALSAKYPRSSGDLMSADDYARVLDGCEQLREALGAVGSQWIPRDLIDVQTLMWLHLGTERETRRRRASKPRLVAAPIGAPYVPVAEPKGAVEIDPFAVDPEKVERGNRGHARTQNSLAEFLRAGGIVPLSPRQGDPEFDLAWWDGDTLFVAEVKSTTHENAEPQLRLGLGQVLRYRNLLLQRVPRVVAVLVPEASPPEGWIELCRSLDVVLTWPSMFASLGVDPKVK